jgi:hypothetical protein
MDYLKLDVGIHWSCGVGGDDSTIIITEPHLNTFV